MKKATLKELENKIRENIACFYAKAYAVTGNREEAEALTEKAVFYGAKRYGDLMNKARFFDIVEQKIGFGDYTAAETTDCDALAERIIKRVRAWNVRSSIVKWVGGTAAVLAILAGSLSLILPKVYEARSNNVVLMENAIAIGGDFDNSEIVNYQEISAELGPDKETLNAILGRVFSERIISPTTTPNGTTYVAVNNFETLEGDCTFTLYCAYADGWEAVGTGDIGATKLMPYTMNFWLQSEIYTFSDNESNVYVVTRLEPEITIYKYDIKTELFEKKASIPFAHITHTDLLFVKFDPDYGENGTAYLIGKELSKLKVFRYDTATDTVSVIRDELELSSEYGEISCCVDQDTSYVIHTTSDGTFLYQIYGDGDWDILRLQEYRVRINSMATDREGRLHLIVNDEEIKHYIFKEDFLYEAETLDQLYYQNTDYYREARNLFLGDDGELYYIETYNDGSLGENCFLALGKLDGEDPSKSTFVNGFDMPDSFSSMRFQGKDIINYTYAHSAVRDSYIIYFHINMLDTED